MSGSLEFISNLGFEFAGEWVLDGDQLKLILNRCQDVKNILYAFYL
jgi:hypothetical protein